MAETDVHMSLSYSVKGRAVNSRQENQDRGLTLVYGITEPREDTAIASQSILVASNRSSSDENHFSLQCLVSLEPLTQCLHVLSFTGLSRGSPDVDSLCSYTSALGDPSRAATAGFHGSWTSSSPFVKRSDLTASTCFSHSMLCTATAADQCMWHTAYTANIK
ncbi:hypothetical protein BaRGS_00009516 [Batillaria attramentaria]|uniref:Uncharacterized protein n=1 Tax=Batillaria attramentaria TaxID=370345 RepID=A0ABD0LID5_9CAEN